MPTPLEIPCILSTAYTAESGGPADPSLEVTTVYSSLYFFLNPFLWLKHTCLEFPGGPWLGLTFTAGGLGSIPGQGTKIPQAAQHGLKKKKEERKRKMCIQLENRSLFFGSVRELCFHITETVLINCSVTYFVKRMPCHIVSSLKDFLSTNTHQTPLQLI